MSKDELILQLIDDYGSPDKARIAGVWYENYSSLVYVIAQQDTCAYNVRRMLFDHFGHPVYPGGTILLYKY